MSKNYLITPDLFLAAILFLGNILCQPAQDMRFKLPDREAPQRTTTGGTRDKDKCFSTTREPSITPLLPSNNFGFTVAEYPTIFIYVPTISIREAFFSLQSESEGFHYQTILSLPKRSGVIGIKLPPKAQPLQINMNYKWSLALICGQQLEPDDPVVTGWIRRVELDSQLVWQQELNVSHESICLLAKEGIWYDTLSHLAQLIKAQPENSFLIAHWQKLLTLVGLEAIATEPLIH